jgi:hypothetical protein
MDIDHISDDDLERYYLGMVTQEEELAGFEEHLLGCPLCAARADETQDFIDLVRQALIQGNYDLEVLP